MSHITNASVEMYRIPAVFAKFTELIAAESTRHGGVSPAPYSSLNLGGSTQDSDENVAQNNIRFFGSLGVKTTQTAKSHQVHGSEILRVISPGRYEGYDALITDIPNIQLAVTIADCTPILIYNPVKQCVAAVHAGWRGTVRQIVLKTVQVLQTTYGSDPKDCLAYVGTCIDDCSFEVGEEVAAHFDSRHKQWNSSAGNFFVNLKQANKDQLVEAGLTSENIEISPYSTVLNNKDYFSYRHENGITGRLLATIGMKK